MPKLTSGDEKLEVVSIFLSQKRYLPNENKPYLAVKGNAVASQIFYVVSSQRQNSVYWQFVSLISMASGITDSLTGNFSGRV